MNTLELAHSLGYRIGTSSDVSPCPACLAETRHTKSNDTRGAVRVNPYNLISWTCFQCEQSGGTKEFQDFHSAAGEPLLLHLSAPRRPSSFSPRELRYPDEQSVLSYWNMCKDVQHDDTAFSYLSSRYGRDIPVSPELRNMVRGHYVGGPLRPGWAAGWAERDRHLHFPLYDVQKKIRSVIARSVSPTERVKSISPPGYARAGLFTYLPGGGDYVVCEGELDALAAWLFIAPQPTVIGIFSGSITNELFNDFIPRSALVVVATDWDEAGEGYYEKIKKLRRGVLRWKQPTSPMQSKSLAL